MIVFFKIGAKSVFAVESKRKFDQCELEKLEWLFSGAKHVKSKSLKGVFVGPRREMITPCSTNAV